jgi:cytoskeleton protein RodZ
MQNVGDRLAEARKRLGIALREASEATKIRTDYLQAMETGTFDFSLPEIYKVGFLKIYARYLKLDAGQLAADYATQFSVAGRGDRDNLGRLDAPGGQAAGGAFTGREAGGANDYNAERAKNQAALFRLLAYLLLAVAGVVILFLGLQHLLNSSVSTDNPGKQASTATTENTPPPAATAPTPTPAPSTMPSAPGMMKLVFAASDDIASLQVVQLDGRKALYNKPLKKGAPQTVTSNGPVEVKVSQVQFLTIKVNDNPPQGIADGNRKPYSGTLDFDWPP